MPVRRGLGRGLGSLIPTGPADDVETTDEGRSVETTDGPERSGRRARGSPRCRPARSCRTASAAHVFNEDASPSWCTRSARSGCCSRSWSARSAPTATSWSWASAGGGPPAGRPRAHPGDRPVDRRLRHAARRAAGEPAPVAAEPAGGGRGLPAAVEDSAAPTTSWRPGSVAPGRRSATPSGCSSSPRPSSAGLPPASSGPVTPARCCRRGRRPAGPPGRPGGRRGDQRARPGGDRGHRRRPRSGAAPARRKPVAPGLNDLADRLSTAWRPGSRWPSVSARGNHRRVRLARRPAPDRRHHGPAQPERPAHLAP